MILDIFSSPLSGIIDRQVADQIIAFFKNMNVNDSMFLLFHLRRVIAGCVDYVSSHNGINGSNPICYSNRTCVNIIFEMLIMQLDL